MVPDVINPGTNPKKSSSSNLPLSRASDKNDLKESIALFPKNPNKGLKMLCCRSILSFETLQNCDAINATNVIRI